MKVEVGTSTASLTAIGVDPHGTDQGAPHTELISAQPSAAIATGIATTDSSKIKTITPRVRISHFACNVSDSHKVALLRPDMGNIGHLA